jgi:glycosyltransferase involved in cell wall biosynthesis
MDKTTSHKRDGNKIRVLYSFPHKLGAARICFAAWKHVNAIAAAGAEVVVFPGAILRPVLSNGKVLPTLAWGKLRIPYKLVGSMRAFDWHDYIISRRIEKMSDHIDIVHTWPLGALRTLKVAAKLGIPSVLERPNAHTQFAYEVVQKECERLGVSMPRGHEHDFNPDVLRKEEEEYKLADRLLCPSDFVMRTFLERGFSPERLARHQYGYDEKTHYPDCEGRDSKRGLSMIFVAGCAPRKGLHFALEAWLKSSAHSAGTFTIVGEFIPGYREKLSHMLSHPSIRVLGFRKDYAELMRKSDILILPSIEEGSALVTYDARGNGCVLLVSEASGAVCQHMVNALVHRVGDVETLAQQISQLNDDRILLDRLRTSSLASLSEITWGAAGEKLLTIYREVIETKNGGGGCQIKAT